MSIYSILEQSNKAYTCRNIAAVNEWSNIFYDSADSVMYHPDGRIKIVLDSNNIKNLNPKSEIGWFESLVLDSGTFDKTEGIEFSRKDIAKYINSFSGQSNSIHNPLWLALARNDASLLEEHMFNVGCRNGNTQFMKVWISEQIPTYEVEKPLSISSINSGSNISGVNGYLRVNSGCLVGIKKIENT